jgi:hypothetical protein
MANNKHFLLMRLLSAVTLLWLPLNQAFADDRLEVRVQDKHSGDAIENAAVCVGTSANPNQFGARRTDARGTVRFTDLLSHSLVVTASKQGYKGSEQRLEPLTRASVVVLKIAPGGGGPRCDAPAGSEPAGTAAGLVIEGVSVRKDPETAGGGRILLSIEVSGAANEVRVSEQADFSDAPWQALRQPLPFDLTEGAGPKQIYVQVRRHAGAQGASIEVTSPAERVRYRR